MDVYRIMGKVLSLILLIGVAISNLFALPNNMRVDQDIVQIEMRDRDATKFETFRYKTNAEVPGSGPWRPNKKAIRADPRPLLKEVSENSFKFFNSAPFVGIESSRDTVIVGEDFTITVRANDMNGLRDMWWYLTFPISKDLPQKHNFKCGGKINVKHSWTISISETGVNIFTADAVDVNYDPTFSGIANKASMIYQVPEVKVLVLEKK